MIRLHSRTALVTKARLEIETAVWNLMGEHGLTYVEGIQVLNGLQDQFLKYMLRSERHPESPDKKGDEA